MSFNFGQSSGGFGFGQTPVTTASQSMFGSQPSFGQQSTPAFGSTFGSQTQSLFGSQPQQSPQPQNTFGSTPTVFGSTNTGFGSTNTAFGVTQNPQPVTQSSFGSFGNYLKILCQI
jgi:hypothetical protein